MGLGETIVYSLMIIASGAAWMGYTFLQTDAKVKMARATGGQSEEIEALKQEIEALKADMADMRETSTSFDLTLESTLHRLEQRVSNKTEDAELQTRIGAEG